MTAENHTSKMPGAVALSQNCTGAQREPVWVSSLLNQARWQGENTKFNAQRYLAHMYGRACCKQGYGQSGTREQTKRDNQFTQVM
jgi:hypothetical protein